MLHTPAVVTDSSGGIAISVNSPESLSGTAILLYQALYTIAIEAKEARGYAEGVAAVTLHCPVDIVAMALQRHRVTIWRAARQLREAGLLDSRPHKATLDGRTVNDGELWAVALRPIEGGVRLRYEDLSFAGWRDLAGDVERGRTAHAAMQQSINPPDIEIDFNLLREWALSPVEAFNPSLSDCCASSRHDLETVLDVQHASRSERPEMVGAAADSLCAALRDAGGRRFYMLLLWQLLRAQDATGAAPWHMVYEQARRARSDALEGYGRKPGALFVSRLKAAPWWSEIRAAPPARVAA